MKRHSLRDSYAQTLGGGVSDSRCACLTTLLRWWLGCLDPACCNSSYSLYQTIWHVSDHRADQYNDSNSSPILAIARSRLAGDGLSLHGRTGHMQMHCQKVKISYPQTVGNDVVIADMLAGQLSSLGQACSNCCFFLW